MKTDQRQPLFSGPGLRVCPRCGSLFVQQYCSDCGEAVPPSGPTWFSLQLGPPRDRGAKLSRLAAKWGPDVVVSAEGSVWPVRHPAHLELLASEVRKRARRGLAVGEFGQVLEWNGPVLTCLTGVADSAIRGCMTQVGRDALCAPLSGLLPLRERMRTSSYCDLLSAGGQQETSSWLLLGILLGLSRRDPRVTCPLFGRSLDVSEADLAAIPFALAALEERTINRPAMLVVSPPASAVSKSSPRLEEDRWNLPVDWKPLGADSMAVSRMGAGLVVVRRDADAATVWVLSHDRDPVAVRELCDVRSVHHLDIGVAVGYRNRSGKHSCGVLVQRSDSREPIWNSYPAAALDAREGMVGVLGVGRRHVDLALSPAVPGSATICRSWQTGPLPEGGWELRLLTAQAALAWQPFGPLLYLGRKLGKLLNPVRGLQRFAGTGSSPLEFPGLVSVAPADPGTALILSSFGHRLTLVRHAVPEGDELPLTVVWDVCLPLACSGMASVKSGVVFLADRLRAWCCQTSNLGIVRVLPPSAGLASVVDGGGLLQVSEGQLSTLMHRRPLGKPEPAMWLDALHRAAGRLGQGVEVGEVTDRLDRGPNRSTWGG